VQHKDLRKNIRNSMLNKSLIHGAQGSVPDSKKMSWGESSDFSKIYIVEITINFITFKYNLCVVDFQIHNSSPDLSSIYLVPYSTAC